MQKVVGSSPIIRFLLTLGEFHVQFQELDVELLSWQGLRFSSEVAMGVPR
jgi:hypothetical protein